MSNTLDEKHEPTVNDIKNQVGCMLKAISQLKSSERSEVFGYIQKCVSSFNSDQSDELNEDATKLDIDQDEEKIELSISVDSNEANLSSCGSVSNNNNNDDDSIIKSDNEVDNNNESNNCKTVDDETKCLLCGKIFSNVKRLYNHAIQHHSGSEIVCEKCEDSFSSKQIYDIHVKLKHGCNVGKSSESSKRPESLKCTYCDKVYQNYQHYSLHIEGHKRNICSICGSCFNKRSTLKAHMSNAHSTVLESDLFVCKFCCKKFSQKRSLLKHYKSIHSKDLHSTMICMSCGMTFNTSEELKSHEQVHIQSILTCSKCDEKFTRKQQYLQHVKNHDKYSCVTCKKSYSNKSKLEQHEQFGHVTEGLPTMHVCSECDATFHFQSSLFFHKKKKHNGSDHYKCDICNRIFTSIRTYKEHKSKFHNSSTQKNMTSQKEDELNGDCIESQDNVTCKVCNKLFQGKRKLLKHQYKYHNEMNLLNCGICEFKSLSASCMSRHKKLHSTKKEFICDKCGDFFYTKNALVEHNTYVHSDERNFNCEKCGRTFKTSNVLNRHMLTHSAERLYACHCGHSYKFISNLNRHQMAVHGKAANSKRVIRLVSDDNIKPKAKKKKELKEKENSSNSVIYALLDSQAVSLPLDHVIVQGNNVILSNESDDPQVIQVPYNDLNFPQVNKSQQLVFTQPLDISNLHEVETILQSEGESLKDNANSIIDPSHETLFTRQMSETDSNSFLNAEGLIHPPIEPSLVTSLTETLSNADQLDNTANQLAAATSQQNLISLNEYYLQYNINLLNM